MSQDDYSGVDPNWTPDADYRRGLRFVILATITVFAVGFMCGFGVGLIF